MNESSSRPRRSLLVVLLDAMLAVATAVQTGNMPGARGATGRPARRTGLVWLVIGVLAAGGGTAVLVTALLRAPDGLADLPPAGLVAPAPTASSSGAAPSSTRPSPSGSSRAATSATPSPSAGDGQLPVVPSSAATSAGGGARLTAGYEAAAGTGLLGYRATVTLTGKGPAASTGWKLTITLPRSTLQIGDVQGATVEQDGTVWTFTPVDATRRIAAGSSVVITFDVLGATLVDAAPTDCRIDGDPCAGLSG